MVENLIKKYSGNKKITETKDYIRLRIKSPTLFKKSSFRTHDIGRKGNSKRLAGRLKKTGEWETQAFIFNKQDLGRGQAITRAKALAEIY